MKCENEVLAQNGPFQVHRCRECGGISVHMHVFTVRLDLHSLEVLGDVIRRAIERTEKHVKSPPVVPLLFSSKIN